MHSTPALPRLRAPSRSGPRPKSRTPDVKLTVSTFQQVPSDGPRTDHAVAVWPRRERPRADAAAVSSTLTTALSSKLRNLIDVGMKTVAVEYPSSKNATREFDAATTLEDSPEMDAESDAIEDLPRGKGAGLNRQRVITAGSSALSTDDKWSVLEAAGAARMEVVRQSLAVFARSFKAYGWFLGGVMTEVDEYCSTLREVQRERSANLVQENRELRERVSTLHSTSEATARQCDDLRVQIQQHRDHDDEVQRGVATAKRELMLVEQLNAELSQKLEDSERLNAIHSRKLFDTEKKMAEVEETLRASTGRNMGLHKQLAARQQVCDKLSQSVEAAYSEKAAMQRQLVSAMSQSQPSLPGSQQHGALLGVGGPRSRRRSQQPIQPELPSPITVLKSFYDAQLEFVQARAELVLSALSSFSRGGLTPRPARVAAGTTSQRFAEMERTLQRRDAELAEMRTRLLSLTELHGTANRDRCFLPGCLGVLGEPHTPVHAEYFMLNAQRWFVAEGVSCQLAHLRASGKIRNLKLTKALTVQYTDEFFGWVAEQDAVLHGQESYTVALARWTTGRFGEESCAEVNYSLHHALRVYAYESRCALLLELITGTASPACFRAIEQFIAYLRQAMVKASEPTDGLLTKRASLAVIERVFGNFDEAAVARIVSAISRENSGDGVQVSRLFVRSGQDSVFLMTAREAVIHDRWVYLSELRDALLNEPTVGSEPVTPHNIVSAVLRVDPRRPDDMTEQVLLHVFGDTIRSTIETSDRETPMSERFSVAGETIALVDALARVQTAPYGRWTRRAAAQAAVDLVASSTSIHGVASL